MNAQIYTHNQLIGTVVLHITDENMGVLSGQLTPTPDYFAVQKVIRKAYDRTTTDRLKAIASLRINAQLENGHFLFPLGGFTIYDVATSSEEAIHFEAAGVYRHILDDYLLATPPKRRLQAPWGYLSISQKLAFEDELAKEIGKGQPPSWITQLFGRRRHRLSKYEFGALATVDHNDDVLFAIWKPGETTFDHAVIHLTWKGKIEQNDAFPATAFYKNFDDFVEHRMKYDQQELEE